MGELFSKCMMAPYVLDREGVNVLILTLLAAIVDEMGIDEDIILRKAQEAIDKI